LSPPRNPPLSTPVCVSRRGVTQTELTDEKRIMKPYYEQDGITIYHAPCEVVLPTLEPVDLLLTDPPYGIGEAAGRNKSRSCIAVSRDYGDAAWDDSPPPRWLLDQAVNKATNSIVFGGNHFGMPPASCWLVWDKDNGENDFADCELAWTNMPKAVRRLRWKWHGMLQEHMGDAKEPRFHPTQKPLAVMTWALSQAPADTKTVLDPWMGSGTTLVAAKLAGLTAIGIEREEKYCKIAVNRLAQGALFAGGAA
jgi:DNA modification methylase